MRQQRILIFHIGSLGDTLAAVPSLWAIRENFPGARVTMLTDAHPARSLVQSDEVLAGSSLIDEYLFYHTGKLLSVIHLLVTIRFKKFDKLVYLVRGSSDSSRIVRDKLFFKLAGIRECVGMKEFQGNTRGASSKLRVADDLLRRLQADGLSVPAPNKGNTSVNIGKVECQNVERWQTCQPMDGGRLWIAVCPGSKMPVKIWPVERYRATLAHLITVKDVWPVVFGGPEDRLVGLKLIEQLGRGYVAAGELSIRDSMSAMRRCALYLGNDTGAMHMAAASGVRCVVPFSSRDVAGKWDPYGEGHIVLRTQIDCQGCMLENCVERQMKCLLSISVDEVSAACGRILGC